MAPPRLARERVGSYEPLLELASGGMGTVSLARHTGPLGFERLVVLKRVHRHLAKERAQRDMLIDEARVASLIRHPNVVPVIDIVEDGAELFLVQEYVESMSMDALVSAARAADERLPVGVVARIVVDALAGLHAAHEATDVQGNPLEVVHRDVSPQNIVVGLDGTSRIVDFGVAKAQRRLTVTSGGILKGKLAYMAPEQLKQLPIDRRADVFSTGVVLYEALTGERPFGAREEGDALLALLVGELENPSALAPGLPPKLDAVVQYSLARDRTERFQTAAAFLQALETAAPPAPPREVAALVERLGGAALALRREAVRAMLGQASGASDSALPAAPAQSTRDNVVETGSPTLGGSSEPAAAERAGPAPRRSATPAVWLGAVCFVLAALGAVALRQVRATSSSAPDGLASAAGSAPTVAPPTDSSTGAPDGAVEIALVADAAVERIEARGMKRVQFDGHRARVWLEPWTGTIVVVATLAGGRSAHARLEAGVSGDVTLVDATPPTSRTSRAPARVAPRRAASTASDLKSNPYGP